MLFIVVTNLFNITHPIIVKEAVDHLESIGRSIPEFRDSEQTKVISEPEGLSMVLSWLGMDTEHSVSSLSELTKLAIKTGILLCVLYIVIALIKGLFLFMTRQTIIVMSRYIEYDLKNEIYDQYQALSRSFYKKNNTGDLMNRISEDVGKVRMYFGPAVMYTINLIVLSVMAIWAMIQISPKLTLVSLAPLPIMSVLIYVVSSIMNKRSELVQEQQSNLSTFVQEAFSGIRVLKAYCRLDGFADMFAKETELYKEKQLSLVKVNALFMPTIILLIGASTLLSIYVGGTMVIRGEDGLTIGDMVAFVIYVNMLTWPFASIGWVTSLVQRASASQARINEFLQLEPEINSGTQPIDNFEGRITFNDVSFTYKESGTEALTSISFEVNPGESFALFGRTGSGKSTIVELLTRQYDPDEGSIAFDNKDIKSFDLSALRGTIGYVPQDVFLFSDTIKNNIAFGKESEANLDEIDKAASLAQVKENIMAFPDKYDTVLGEWGISLSGGQKQRVSIARAIIRHPKVLIFDDSLSAVDTETEESILRGLDTVMENVTTILVSHRVSTVARAKKIMVLDNGRIADMGTHEELLSRVGFYRSMHEKQSLEMRVNN